MIRTTVYAWLSGMGLVFAAAALTPQSGSPPANPRGTLVAAATPGVEPLPAGRRLAALDEPLPAAAPPQPAVPEPPPAAPLTPAVVIPAAVTPAAVTPAAVQFDGVSPSQIVGDRVNLNLATSGNITSYTWTVMPPGTVGMKVYEGGAKADFTSRFPGTYVFLVAVAGSDGSVAQAYHTLELRADCPPPAPNTGAAPAAAPVTGATAPALTALAAAAPQATAADPSALVRQWAAEVKSPRRRAEQLQIASGFRQAAGAIDSGLFAGGDLFARTKGLCLLALGGDAGAWGPWFDQVEELYREFGRLKLIGTPANFSAANKSVARALEAGE